MMEWEGKAEEGKGRRERGGGIKGGGEWVWKMEGGQ